MDSDDSDFYGNEYTISSLKERVDSFDVDEWVQQQQQHPGRALPQRNLPVDTPRLHNPYAGVPYAWQLNETVDDFLERLPPRTTKITDKTPWIFICNPYIPRVEKSQASNQTSKGNEDEAPEEFGSRTNVVVEGGHERLDMINHFAEGLKKSRKTKATQDREVQQERKRAIEDVLNLAQEYKVKAGKWMIFCQPAEVNDVWEIVAKATAKNELGIAAKVAPKPVDEDPRKDRLICVYTTDFRDKSDVGRVLQKLRELRLVETRGRPIYYKPDAFTYIGVSHGNSWGIKASIYSSMDIFQAQENSGS